jgi:hypothetical protein
MSIARVMPKCAGSIEATRGRPKCFPQDVGINSRGTIASGFVFD